MAKTSPQTAPRKRKRHIVLWTFLVLIVCGVLWGLLSDNPFAQGFQSLLGWEPDQVILNSSFKMYPRGFRYYKFTVPAGSGNVLLVGQFEAHPDNQSAAVGTEASAQGVELYVVPESEFPAWIKGDSAQPYQIGRIAKGTLRQPLPASAGDFYLIVSNRFDSSAAKDVKARISLRHNHWLPDLIRNLKGDR